MDIREFSLEMMHHFSGNIPDLEAADITGRDEQEALALAESRYRQWEWNFAYGPDYLFINNFMFEGQQHSCTFKVSAGLVSECTITGSGKMLSAAESLVGCRHMANDFLSVFEKEKIAMPDDEIFNFF